MPAVFGVIVELKTSVLQWHYIDGLVFSVPYNSIQNPPFFSFWCYYRLNILFSTFTFCDTTLYSHFVIYFSSHFETHNFSSLWGIKRCACIRILRRSVNFLEGIVDYLLSLKILVKVNTSLLSWRKWIASVFTKSGW